MLLSNVTLREQAKARAMSYLAVLTLHIVDLVDIVVSFDEARARLRWAQIQIAAMRGIIRLATRLQDWERRRGMSKWDLTEGERISLYRNILQGGDEVIVEADYYFESRKTVGSMSSLEPGRRISYDSYAPPTNGRRGSVVSATRSNDEMKILLTDLAESVQDLQSQLRRTQAGKMNMSRSVSVLKDPYVEEKTPSREQAWRRLPSADHSVDLGTIPLQRPGWLRRPSNASKVEPDSSS